MQIYPRKIVSEIEKYLELPEIVVIHGARQTGKTTVLTILIEGLKAKTKPENIVYFDLEDFALVDLANQGAKAVVEHLRGLGCDFSRRIFLLIDEIQYLERPDSFLKYFHDHWKDEVKLVVSGSSSFAIKSKFKESLVGRTIDFELFGLDFEEFLVFKQKSFDLGTKDSLIVRELSKLYQEFVTYGTYPRIVLEDSVEVKERLLKQIINTYIKRDIKDLARIADVGKFNRLLKILASQSGSLVNVLELANTTGLSRPTLENYLMILENTYIIKFITPFYRNVRRETTKMPKMYFEDQGIKNILEQGGFPKKVTGSDLEAGVYANLRKNMEASQIHFWRTTAKEEINFVVTPKEELRAYEVKLQARNKDRFVLEQFQKHYPDGQTYLVGLKFIDEKKHPNLAFLYPWQIVHSLVSKKQ